MVKPHWLIKIFSLLLIAVFIKPAQAQSLLSLDNVAELELIRSFDIGTEANTFFISPDGRYLIVAAFFGTDGTIWDLSLGEIHYQPEAGSGYTEYINTVFSPDGRYFVTFSGATILLHDIETTEVVKQNTEQHGEIIFFDFSPDSRWLAIGYRDRGNGTVEIWDLENLSTKHVLDQDLNTLRFSPDSRFLAVGTSGNSIYVWEGFEQEDATSNQVLRGGNSSVWNIGFSTDSRYMLVHLFNGGNGTNPMIVLDSQSRNPHYESEGLEENRILNPSANIAIRYASREDEDAVLWDVASLEIISELDEPGFWVKNHALSLDERMFISRPEEGELVIWDVHSGEEIHNLENQNYGFFSPNGTELITLSGTTLSVWAIPN